MSDQLSNLPTEEEDPDRVWIAHPSARELTAFGFYNPMSVAADAFEQSLIITTAMVRMWTGAKT